MKTALVLSGGAMYGAYQVGAWEALERAGVRPDLVVGASVGSLNGWSIAAGVPACALREQWLDREAGRLTRRTPLGLFMGGLFDRRVLVERAKFLTANHPLRMPFALTAVSLPRFRTELFRDSDVTWRHLVASCSVPGGFAPMRIGGRFYIDGGILCALPIWAAQQLGATRIYALNALPTVPSRTLRTLSSGVRRMAVELPPQPDASRSEIIRIQPPGPLGDINQSINWERGRIEEWMERGRMDAEAKLVRLAA